ncbi:Cytochrome P460 [Bryocella elongata]|uniref:Cytochrome P460 n=1 Tax=Bryocella elongata TaxID=863522 RepID=A0A1H5T0H9_9BACT|nr:cytochrome P460 family protein [Bryocella elongata]SEF56275.1 Cytochrome P460 [Bryocella elongata]
MLKALATCSGLLLAGGLTFLNPAASPAPFPNAPAYSAKGALLTPKNYREWQYLTTGVDMSYASTTEPQNHIFDNVFVNPESYAEFKRTGTWPDKTTFILEVRGADSPVSINKRGHTQSAQVRGLEIHVKDKGEWSFYEGAAGKDEAELLPKTAACYSCHESHGAVATTFVQFYPTLLPIATEKKTLSPEYLKESAEAKP